MSNITPSLLAPDHLRVNLQHFAYNVQAQPHFSWWNHSNRTGASQSAYQLTVFQRLQDRQDHNYLYDSGWVTSSNNTAVTAAKLSDQLVAGQLYYWQVRIKDNAGNISDFSQPAKLICADPSLPVKHGIWRQPQPKTAQELAHIGQVVFLRSPQLKINPSEVDTAIIVAVARGNEPVFAQSFDLYLNGHCLGLARLANRNTIMEQKKQLFTTTFMKLPIFCKTGRIPLQPWPLQVQIGRHSGVN